jgi:hypothetical protein
MNQRIVYETGEGGVAVLIPAPECGLSIEEIAQKDVPSLTAYEVVDASVIPSDRTFRGAWSKQGSAVTIDMPKARDIKRNIVRAEREAELARLDVEFMRALESGNVGEQNRIKAEKQRYRDAPAHPKIEQAATPEALKALRLFDLI